MPGQMIEIRQWLDHRGCNLINFEYREFDGNSMCVQLEFAEARDAFDFAEDFDGAMAFYN